MRYLHRLPSITCLASALLFVGCSDDTTVVTTASESETGEDPSGDGDASGDGDGDPSGDGDGDPSGDGDGDPSGDGDGDPSGDGDGDPSGDGDGDATGDGDGDPTGDGDGDPTGDGDGDPTGDGDGDPGLECNPDAESMVLSLVGSQAPMGSCNDHTFMGRLELGGGGSWGLDACPCGANCLLPDPYALTINLANDAMLPAVPACLTIKMVKNEACEVESLVIRDLDNQNAVVWAASIAPSEPDQLQSFAVEAIGPSACEGYDQYALEFSQGDESLVLEQGQAGSLADGPDIENFASQELDEGPNYAWVAKF